MELLAIKLEGKTEVLQCIKVLVPLHQPSLNMNVCGLHCSRRDGYSNEKPPLEDTIFLDNWDIIGSKY